MLEELCALENSKACIGIFTVQQTPEGKVERYKGRLVARGKMSTVRTIMSCAANFGGRYISWMSKMLSCVEICKRRFIWRFHVVCRNLKQLERYVNWKVFIWA